MASPISKMAPTAVVVAAVSYCAWPYVFPSSAEARQAGRGDAGDYSRRSFHRASCRLPRAILFGRSASPSRGHPAAAGRTAARNGRTPPLRPLRNPPPRAASRTRRRIRWRPGADRHEHPGRADGWRSSTGGFTRNESGSRPRIRRPRRASSPGSCPIGCSWNARAGRRR